MGLVEEEHQLRLVQVAHFGQRLEQLGQHPQQEARVQPRRVHQLVGGEDVDDAQATIGLHEIGDVEHGLAEEAVTTLGFDLQQAALDRADAGRRDVAVLRRELARVVADILQRGAQVLQVQQQQALVVGDLEHQLQHAGLGLVERQHAAQQQRAHVGHGGAHRMALLAEHVPERGGAGDGLGRLQPTVLQGGQQLFARFAGLADAGQVALHIGHEDRHPKAREALRQGLQADGLAGAGRAGDQAVAVGQCGQQPALDVAMAGQQDRVGHGRSSKILSLPTINQAAAESAAGSHSLWPDIPNGPIFSTAKAARTRSAARSGPASFVKSPSLPGRAAPRSRTTRGCGWRSTRPRPPTCRPIASSTTSTRPAATSTG
mmetsp:Transcript_120347/g.334872  ORF Transcript_120347/g.334872 Transcript_120347/m.334872 type:complete len:374 (+) Transcript_120347:42-1163(+)